MEALVPFASASNNEPPVSPNHRQSILGSLLRGRPRGASQSHQHTPSLHIHPDYAAHSSAAAAASASPTTDMNNNNSSNNNANSNNNNNPASPVTPGHRRRPAAAATSGIQASVSQGIAASSNNASGGLSQYLRRRRSANALPPITQGPPSGANYMPNNNLNSNSSRPVAPPANNANSNSNSNANANGQQQPASGLTGRSHRLRLVPHLDSHRSLHFDPISRDVKEGDQPIRLGRFTDRSGMGINAVNSSSPHKLAFKSKVVSRAHAEVWVDQHGKFFIRDTKSSSGTFLNHLRLSAPNAESAPFPLKDGDVLQLGVDYQGGTEDIYKCVKMKVEVGREWQSMPNAFNTNAMKQIKALSGVDGGKAAATKSGIADCCICLFSVRVHQSLFIPPCSHVFHYKCIRPLLQMHHPGFNCPLCRTFANLEEDVEVENEEIEEVDVEAISGENGGDGVGGKDGMEGVVKERVEQKQDAQRNEGGNANVGMNRNLPDVPGDEWMDVDYVAPDEREDGSSSMHHHTQHASGSNSGPSGPSAPVQMDATMQRRMNFESQQGQQQGQGGPGDATSAIIVMSSTNHPFSNHPLSVAMGSNSRSNVHLGAAGGTGTMSTGFGGTMGGMETEVERDVSPRIRAVLRGARTAVEDDDDNERGDRDVDEDEGDEDEDEEMRERNGVTDIDADGDLGGDGVIVGRVRGANAHRRRGGGGTVEGDDEDEDVNVVRHPVIPDLPGLGLGSGVRLNPNAHSNSNNERGRSRSVSRVGAVRPPYADDADDDDIDDVDGDGDGDMVDAMDRDDDDEVEDSVGSGLGSPFGRVGGRGSGRRGGNGRGGGARAASVGARAGFIPNQQPITPNSATTATGNTPTTANTTTAPPPTTTTTTHSERRQSWRRAIASITRPATADPSSLMPNPFGGSSEDSAYGHGHPHAHGHGSAHGHGHTHHAHSHSPAHGRSGGNNGNGGGGDGYTSAAEGRNPFRRFVGGVGLHSSNNNNNNNANNANSNANGNNNNNNTGVANASEFMVPLGGMGTLSDAERELIGSKRKR